MSHSAAAMKSSKQFCLVSFMPPWCQSLPYSPPPRMLATAYTPPISIHTSRVTRNDGVIGMLNPPYPYSSVGFLPFSERPFLCVMNMGTRVPSLLS